MGEIRNVVSAIETQLAGLGYGRAAENFTLEQVPASIAHKSYTFGQFISTPIYTAGDTADYSATPLSLYLLVLWKVIGAHNVTGTAQEGYLDALDALEELENELVGNQLQIFSEEISIINSEVQPYYTDDSQEFLILGITLGIELARTM